MKEKYYKIRKEIAARAGLDERLREAVGEDHLLLSEKDIRMISLTFDERLHAIGACTLCENEDDSESEEDVVVENEEPTGTDEEVEPETTEEDGN